MNCYDVDQHPLGKKITKSSTHWTRVAEAPYYSKLEVN